jgi:hypothetical protein
MRQWPMEEAWMDWDVITIGRQADIIAIEDH